MVTVKSDGSIHHGRFAEPGDYKPCSFERIYFSRGNDPDIYRERKAMGEALVPQVVDAIDGKTEKAVFSFVPNTAETATLTPLNFQILVALVEGERHGYAIMQQIEERAGGAFRIGAGSLYRAIKQLVDAKFITEAKPKLQVHSQRRYYRITATGRRLHCPYSALRL